MDNVRNRMALCVALTLLLTMLYMGDGVVARGTFFSSSPPPGPPKQFFPMIFGPAQEKEPETAPLRPDQRLSRPLTGFPFLIR